MDNIVSIEKQQEKKVTIKTWRLFIIASFLSVVVTFLFQEMIMTKDIYYSLYGGQLEEYRIDRMIELVRKYQKWGYIFIPIVIWLRIAVVSFLIQTPFLLMFKELSFQKIFRIVMIAYFVFIAADFIRFIYLYIQPQGNLTIDSLSFMPLAITNFLEKKWYSDISYSFLSKINIFEFLWAVVVFLGLRKTKTLENIDYILIILGVWIGTMALTYGTIWFIGVIS